jgi:bacteriocin biosynthesis cyclodehydratase domain-containing protein
MNAPARPRLKATIDVFPTADGSVHLFRGGEDDFEIEPDGRPVAALLGLLDGRDDLAGLRRRVRADALPFSDEEVEAIVAQLWVLGAVEDAIDDERLGAEAVRRYDRQLRYFGDLAPPTVARGSYQRRLARARVAVLGVGGLGGWAAYALGCAGIGTLVLVDGDVVEWSNMNRQILYRESDVGSGKAQAAARALRAFNSDVEVEPVARMLRGRAEVEGVIAGADFVVDAADQPVHDIEHWVNEACFRLGIPYAMMSQFPPLVRVGPTYVPGETGCYACQERGWRVRYPLFGELAGHRRRHPCPAAAFGPACGLIGSLVATDVVHHLSGLCRPASLGAALTIDMRTLEVERTPVERVADCAVCGCV